MYAALQAGQVDALLQDLPVNLEHIKDGEYVIVEEYETDEQYGFALKKEGNEALSRRSTSSCRSCATTAPTTRSTTRTSRPS